MEGAKWIIPIKYDKSICQPNSTSFLSLSLGSTADLCRREPSRKSPWHQQFWLWVTWVQLYRGLACSLYRQTARSLTAFWRQYQKHQDGHIPVKHPITWDKVHNILRENVFDTVCEHSFWPWKYDIPFLSKPHSLKPNAISCTDTSDPVWWQGGLQ